MATECSTCSITRWTERAGQSMTTCGVVQVAAPAGRPGPGSGPGRSPAAGPARPASRRARRPGEAATSRNPVPFAAACWWARTSRLMPDESQNRVAVMSAMTVLTPGAMADPRCWPARPALAMSISAGSAITTAGNCGGPGTRAIPFDRAAASRKASTGPFVGSAGIGSWAELTERSPDRCACSSVLAASPVITCTARRIVPGRSAGPAGRLGGS
jgi:hypothetical protein